MVDNGEPGNGTDDYDNWTWEQIETAILGGVDMSVDRQAVARDEISSPESFDTSGELYDKVQTLLKTVHGNIQTWADSILGVDGHWRGKGADSFKQMTDLMLATVDAVHDSLAGPPSYKDTLHDSGVALQTAIDEITEADRTGAQAVMDKYNDDSAKGLTTAPQPWRTEGNTNIVDVSIYPDIEAEMTEKMRTSIKKLAGVYRTTMDNLRDPGEPTFPLPGEDGADPNAIPVTPVKPSKKPPRRGSGAAPFRHAKPHAKPRVTPPHPAPPRVPTDSDFPPGVFHITSAPVEGPPGPALEFHTGPNGQPLELHTGPNGQPLELHTGPNGQLLDGPIGGPTDPTAAPKPTFGAPMPCHLGYDPLTHLAGTGIPAFSAFAPGVNSPDGGHFLSLTGGNPGGPLYPGPTGPALPAARAAGQYGLPLAPVAYGYAPYVRSGRRSEVRRSAAESGLVSSFTAGTLPHENFISAPPGPGPGPVPGQGLDGGAPIMPGMIGHRGPAEEEGHDAESWLVEMEDPWAGGTQTGPSFLSRSER